VAGRAVNAAISHPSSEFCGVDAREGVMVCREGVGGSTRGAFKRTRLFQIVVRFAVQRAGFRRRPSDIGINSRSID
jgi:hypothetical protein